MDSTKSGETLTDDAKIKSDLFNLAEKLQTELQKKHEELQGKDEELQKKDEELAKEKQELSARANEVANLETKLTSAQVLIHDLQLSRRDSFPSNSCCYHIDVGVSLEDPRYLFVDESDRLRARDVYTSQSKFRFTKKSNGTFLIYSIAKGKYLQTQPYSYYSRVGVSTNNEDSAEEFVLFFHLQNEQDGLLVDIGTLTGSFLCMRDNYVVANSPCHNQPAGKFLIVIADEDDY